jgi:hypothetical protein
MYERRRSKGLPSYKEAWMDKYIFENWFHKEFVRDHQYFLKEKALL